jgi:deoxyadenosine/deoxycytidine kinase
MSSKIIISIEGNIGVGKSSFLGLLKNVFGNNAEFVYEPIEDWLSIKDNNGKDLLQTFYDDKTRWSYTFQNIAYITRMNKLITSINSTDKKFIILDRSLEADLNTFSKMLHTDGHINDLEWNAYNLWNKFYYENFGKNHQHFIVYLRCDPETAYNRIKIRNRNQECSIPLDYLKSLHQAHEDWLVDIEHEYKCENDICTIVPKIKGKSNKTLIVNADNEFIYNKENFENIYDEFQMFISKIENN